MNRITNPLIMVLPEESLGLMIAGMLVVGGLLIAAGARRPGTALVVGAIAIPFVSVLVEAVLNDFFELLPPGLVQPIASMIMLWVYIAIAMAMVRLVFGDKAVEEAKGILLADAAKQIFKFLFWWPVLIAAVIAGLMSSILV